MQALGYTQFSRSQSDRTRPDEKEHRTLKEVEKEAHMFASVIVDVLGECSGDLT